MNLYVIRGGSFCKIGIARDVSLRLRAIQTGNPYRLRIVFQQAVPAKMARDIEARALAILRQKANPAEGEWFATDWQGAIVATREACQAVGAETGTEAVEGYKQVLSLTH